MPEIPLGTVVGPYFTPSVDNAGNLSWTNNGGLTNPPTVNITGTLSPEDLQRITNLESGKVDKVSGKGLSTNDYTTAEKNKLLGIEVGAQVNEVTSAHYRSMMAILDNSRAVFKNFLYTYRIPVYMTAVGNGVVNVMDAAAGQIGYIQVDSELAGQTLYVQVSNASGMTEAQTAVDENGYATVNLSTVRGENRFYITTQAYAFPPMGNGEHGELNGVYVNPRVNENWLSVYDFIRPANSVQALVRYCLDFDLYSEIAEEVPIEELLAGTGKGVRYVAVENPQSSEYMCDFLYMKLDGYPYGTQDNPAYVPTAYPNPDCLVYYVRRFYDLTE